MSSSHQSTTMSLQQAKNDCHEVVTKYLKYFPISQIVSGKGSMLIIISLTGALVVTVCIKIGRYLRLQPVACRHDRSRKLTSYLLLERVNQLKKRVKELLAIDQPYIYDILYPNDKPCYLIICTPILLYILRSGQFKGKRLIEKGFTIHKLTN